MKGNSVFDEEFHNINGRTQTTTYALQAGHCSDSDSPICSRCLATGMEKTQMLISEPLNLNAEMNGTEKFQGLEVSWTKVPILPRYVMIWSFGIHKNNKKISDGGIIIC